MWLNETNGFITAWKRTQNSQYSTSDLPDSMSSRVDALDHLAMLPPWARHNITSVSTEVNYNFGALDLAFRPVPLKSHESDIKGVTLDITF